jgi:hypothetical protein
MSYAGVRDCKFSYHSLYRLLGFWIEGEIWKVIGLEVIVDG